jgi:hypothetical protein
MRFLVPAGTFNEHAINIATVFRFLLNVGVRYVIKESELEA